MEKRRFVKWADILIVASILIISAIMYAALLNGGGGRYAELLADNEVIQRIDLSKDTEFSPIGYDEVILQVREGRIAFLSSNCPDKVCVRTGYIKNVGQSAVCLPNRLTLRIVGNDSEIDAHIN